jgi:hypothetical protein
LDPKEKINKGIEKVAYLIGSSKMCILRQVYVILGSRRTRWERSWDHEPFVFEKPEGRDHVHDLGEGRRMILKWILRE